MNLPEEPKGGRRATTRDPGGCLARPHPGPRQGASWLPRGSSQRPPSPIFTPRIRNPWTETLSRETLSVPPPPPFQDRGCLEKLLRHPARRRYPLRETIHSHGRLPYVP